jgi:NADH-ubiquinone oxidoreductase chain 5
MYLCIVFLPLIGSISALLFGRLIGQNGAVLLTTFCLFCSWLCSAVAFYEVGLSGSSVFFSTFTWFDSELFFCEWGFLFDSLTVVILIVVTTVSTLVHLYSSEYIKGDPHLPRFISYLSLFTFFILILVTADNFLQIFVGWEGVGLCSYLLINFWFIRLQANKAAIKAILVNRVGDFGLALAIFAIFLTFKATDYLTVFSIAPFFQDSNFIFLNIEFNILTVICLLRFVGAVGKSAQLGLHTWLPDAIEGPTPVSALIHAATIVTAGVFLIARCSPLYEYSSQALVVVTFFGAMTAFFAATTGLVQNDLKRVIAYSTCSQLGYMIFACGLSSYSVGVFHLANHAMFKALLFLTAGSVIHAMSDEQDIRKIGGLVRLIPFSYAIIFIGSLSLIGFPFLTGFYSKDVILELAYAKYSIIGHFAHWLGTLAAFCTAFYSIRLIYLTFLTETNSYKKVIEHAHEGPLARTFPLFFLSWGSIFLGYLTKDIIIGVGTDFWNNALFVLPQNIIMLEAEFIPHYIKLTPVIFSIAGASLAFLLYKNYRKLRYNFKISGFGKSFYIFLNRKWFFDKIYGEFIAQPFLNFGYHVSYKMLDRGFFELLGPYGLSNVIYKQSQKIISFQTGLIYHYAFIILLSVTFLITLIGLWNLLYLFVDIRIFFFIYFIIFGK